MANSGVYTFLVALLYEDKAKMRMTEVPIAPGVSIYKQSFRSLSLFQHVVEFGPYIYRLYYSSISSALEIQYTFLT